MSTELVTFQSNTAKPTDSFIRDGIAGNSDVVFAMIKIIRDSVKYDKGLETLAKNLLLHNGLTATSPKEKVLELIFNFIGKQGTVIIAYDTNGQPKYNTRKDNPNINYVAYIQDIAGNVESIKSARQTLTDLFGDCDDLTILAASLAGALGFENTCVCVARYFQTETSFSHIYFVAYENGVRYVLDNSIPNGNFNQEIHALEKKEIKIDDNIKGLDGFSGVVFNTKYHLNKLAGFAQTVAPYASNFLPLGFLTGKVFKTSISFFNEESANSYNATATKVNHALNEIIRKLMTRKIAYNDAKADAAKYVASLSVIENLPDKESYQIITNSVKQRLQFIRNFPAYAKANNIEIIYSNDKLKAAIGLTAIGYGSYQFYKRFKKGKF